MKRILQAPLFWTVIVFTIVVIASYVSGKKENAAGAYRVWSLESHAENGADYALIRPFVSAQGTYHIAFEGGRQPVFAVEIPSVDLGSPSECPLQVLLLGDWDAPATHLLYRRLEKLYREDRSASLPPLRLSLLPGRTGLASGHFMESIIAVHFVANQVTTLSTFLGEISGGSIVPDKAKIRARLEQIEPEIAVRIDPFLQSQKTIVEKSYLVSRAQMGLHEKALGCGESLQLVSMKQILTGQPGDEQIRAFLVRAKAAQDAFLASPAGLIPVEPKRLR